MEEEFHDAEESGDSHLARFKHREIEQFLDEGISLLTEDEGILHRGVLEG